MPGLKKNLDTLLKETSFSIDRLEVRNHSGGTRKNFTKNALKSYFKKNLRTSKHDAGRAEIQCCNATPGDVKKVFVFS